MLVALISTYREGRTVQHAIRSALAGCDEVIVCEGPAGPLLTDDVPATDTGMLDGFSWQTGRWRTDARKRTAMIEMTRRFDAPVWVLWLDGDEVLMNPEYLRDWTDLHDWLTASDGVERPRIPLRKVELDGSIAMCYGNLVRGDLVKTYTVSTVNLVTASGEEVQGGNHHEHFSGWAKSHPKAQEGWLYWPPGPAPCDPYIVHRSALRHPSRAGLRLHDQEKAELAKVAGAASGSVPADI